ncbi:MAG: NAD-dependent epimerase/dehydratase family protein [Opitutaceae bacterium]
MNANAYGNFSGKHLLIFGCGYIGGEVARQALERGVRVTALTRNEEKAAGLQALGVKAVVADLASDSWRAEVGDADWALNCVSSGGGGTEGYRRSYLAGMKSVLAWAGATGTLEALVYTSSTSVYPQDGGVTVNEDSPATGRDERTAVLVETENVLRTETKAARRRVVLRLAGIYGPGRTHLLQQVRAGEVSGTGPHHLNLIHRDDVCSAIWAALSAPMTEGENVFNVADDGAATREEIVTWLAEQLGVPVPRFTGEPAGGRAPTPDRIVANAKLKTALGWQPRFRDFREGYANLLSR